VIQQQFWMKKCDILVGIKTYAKPSYILSGGQDPPKSHDVWPWLNHKRAEFIGNKQTKVHSPLYISTDVCTAQLNQLWYMLCRSAMNLLYYLKFYRNLHIIMATQHMVVVLHINSLAVVVRTRLLIVCSILVFILLPLSFCMCVCVCVSAVLYCSRSSKCCVYDGQK